MARVLVTGANGFVGGAVCATLPKAGHEVRAAIRSPIQLSVAPGAAGVVGEVVSVGDIGPETDWRAALDGVDVVVHLAARVHVLKEALKDPWARFRRVNVFGTEKLARAAAESGVERLVYVSSIGVNGSSTHNRAFTEADKPMPHNHYAISKWDAEKALRRVADETGLDVVILRPPLVYGPGVKANFLRLMHLINWRLPLPLRSVENRRSLIYVGNLADAVATCVSNPRATGELFLLGDGKVVATPGLLRSIASALHKPAVLLPCSPDLLQAAGRITGMSSTIEPLLDSLALDDGKIRRTLGWHPPYTMTEGLRETARWYKQAGNGYAP